jgi:hypothetical protein
MKKLPESKAMTEIREIRELLSQELKNLPPDEWVSFIHKKAAAFEKKHGLNLVHAGFDDEQKA